MLIIVCLNNDLRLTLIYFRQDHIFSLIFLNGGKCVDSYIKEIVFKLATIGQNSKWFLLTSNFLYQRGCLSLPWG